MSTAAAAGGGGPPPGHCSSVDTMVLNRSSRSAPADLGTVLLLLQGLALRWKFFVLLLLKSKRRFWSHLSRSAHTNKQLSRPMSHW